MTSVPALASGDVRPWEYSAFPVTVAAVRRVTPNFQRVTLAGPMLRHFAPWGLDQRIKLVLPLPEVGIVDVGLRKVPTPHPREWYTRWKSLPASQRNPLRTYTPAAIRPDEAEIDVDVFLHEPAGPASHWAMTCAPGDELMVTGPDARAGYTGYGIHFTPPTPPTRLLLVGDASAIPAMRNIVQTHRNATRIEVLAELADADDLGEGGLATLTTAVAPDVSPGSALERLVRGWANAASAPLRDDATSYVWIAGETGAVARIRRHLTSVGVITPKRVSFLGYWKHGGPLVD